MARSITAVPFGAVGGKKVRLWKLVNAKGSELDITEYGGRLVRAIFPDRYGNMGDVVLGYDTLEQYLADTTYQGALVGRYGNRIGDGQFTLDGKTYKLDLNNAPGGIPCNLHGGPDGFSMKVWDAEPFELEDKVGIILTCKSPDGGEGFPGAVVFQVTTWLSDDDVWHISYKATTTKRTFIAPTSHSYWNLDGAFNGGDIMDHTLWIGADEFTPYGPAMIPFGNFAETAGTPLDFRDEHRIGDRVNERSFDQIAYGNGYDQNWVLRLNPSDNFRIVAQLRGAKSGRRMEVWTTEPGIQIYDGSYLEDGLPGKAGGKYSKNCGIAMETQHYPDSPNKPMFPSTLVKPGIPLYSMTEYRFRAE